MAKSWYAVLDYDVYMKQTSIICTGLLFVPPPEADLAWLQLVWLGRYATSLTSAFNLFLKHHTGLQWGMLDSLKHNIMAEVK